LINQGQHVTAKALLAEFLKTHQSADDIQRRLELILYFKRPRAPPLASIKSKQRSKELLIKDVNHLVALGKLRAAESLLLEAIGGSEEPDFLNLLSRVYMLQRRPMDGAKAMQRALLLQRQQQAFVEIEPEEFTGDLPTGHDLAFISESAQNLTKLENPSAAIDRALTEKTDSRAFIQYAASQYLSLKTDAWWERQPDSMPSGASPPLNVAEALDEPDTAPDAKNNFPGEPLAKHESTPPSFTKTVLKLAHSPKVMRAEAGMAKVRVFKKSWRPLLTVQQIGLGAQERSNSDESPSQPSPLPAPEIPGSTSKTYDETSEENYDVSEENYEVEDDEHLALTDLELNLPILTELNFGNEDVEDQIDLDNDLKDLSIFELGADQGEDIPNVVADFRDLDDEYAAYAFDPDEVFDGEEALSTEPYDGEVDKLSPGDRALQKAAELIGKTNWPLSALPLVQQIFFMSSGGQTRLALEREIEKGMTPAELVLAAHIKVIWAENDIYWIAFDKTGSSRLSHYVLSWPTALLIVRSFESLPQVEEIEVLLEDLFSSWYENAVLRRAFKAFARYLWFRFANLEGCLPANQPFDFCDPHALPSEEYSDLGLSDALGYERTEILRTYGVFQTKNPQEPGCYFSDKPPPLEETPSINSKKRPKEQTENAETSCDIDAEEDSSSR
jgi:hypothetical protein